MLTIELENGDRVGELSSAGTPSAVKSALLWHLLKERRRAVTVRVRDGAVEVQDGISCERIGPWENADPSDLTSAADVQAFMRGLTDEAGWLRHRRVRMVPISVSPPRTYAFVTFTDASDNEMTLRVQYDIPRWKWRLRHWLWEMGNKFLDR